MISSSIFVVLALLSLHGAFSLLAGQIVRGGGLYRTRLYESGLYSKDWTGPSPEWYSQEMQEHAIHLLKSYKSLSGKDLVPAELVESDPEEAMRSLFLLHDRVVVSHGTQADAPNGPILNYGNTAALARWGASWEQLTTMPSRFTAEPMERSARDAFLARVNEFGIVSDYSGVRISVDGTRFTIRDADVWNIVVDGQLLGQAATFLRLASTTTP